MRIDGAVGLVTGGASGLGGGTARMLVEGGGRVGILDLPSSAGEAYAAELGRSAVFVPCDVADEGQVEKAATAVADRFGDPAGVTPTNRSHRGRIGPPT